MNSSFPKSQRVSQTPRQNSRGLVKSLRRPLQCRLSLAPYLKPSRSLAAKAVVKVGQPQQKRQVAHDELA
jgi:hypothetical protein